MAIWASDTLDALRVGAAVEAALDGEAGAGGGAGDQLDDHLEVSRGLPRQFWVMKANRRCSIRFHLTRLFGLRPLMRHGPALPCFEGCFRGRHISPGRCGSNAADRLR